MGWSLDDWALTDWSLQLDAAPPAADPGRPFNPHNVTRFIVFPAPVTDDDVEAIAVLLLL